MLPSKLGDLSKAAFLKDIKYVHYRMQMEPLYMKKF